MHFDGHPVRAHVRFSNGGGDPTVPDATRDARGIAVKLYLPDGTTTDVIGITLPVFFTRTPEDLIEFNIARRPDPETGALDLAKVGAFLEQHPETVPAVTAAMTLPIPASYALLSYNALAHLQVPRRRRSSDTRALPLRSRRGRSVDHRRRGRGPHASYLREELESR